MSGTGARLEPVLATDAVLACCAGLYTNPLVELLVGESLHPGGLTSTSHLLKTAGMRPGARLLDAGCGLGASARLAAREFGLAVDAVDGSARAIQVAATRASPGRIHWQRANLDDLPYDAGSFDGVLAECVLSTTERDGVLREIVRVLKPGAVLMMSDVEVDADAVPALAGHRLLGAALCVTDAWRPGEAEASLAGAGLTIGRRWDMTPSILELVDRAEARVALASVAARDLGMDLALLAGPAAAVDGGFDAQLVRDLAEQVRAAVRRGQLRYFGLTAVVG